MSFENILRQYGWYITGALTLVLIYFIYKQFKKTKCSNCGASIKDNDEKRTQCMICDKKVCNNCAANWINETLEDGTAYFCCKEHQTKYHEENEETEEEDDEEEDEEPDIEYFCNKKYILVCISIFNKTFFETIQEFEKKGYKVLLTQEDYVVFRKED